MANQVEMMSLRNFTLKCMDGYCIPFKAKVPRMVRAQNVEAAMKAGCAPTDSVDLPADDKSKGKATDFAGTLRDSLLYLGCKTIAERNDVEEDFSGNTPKAAVLSKEVGFKVAAKETAEAFQVYLASTKSDEEFIVHPDAERVIMVHKAANIGELHELADLFEYPHDEYKSLGSGDLRMYMLEKMGAGQ